MNNTLLVVVIVVGLVFDFTNGFRDTANYVATWVGTRALTPRMAVAVSAVANLAGAFVTTAVAKTVAKGIIDAHLATQKTILAALLGAIVWNLLTWWIGLPSSSTHALIGGLIGAALVQSGASGVQWHGIVEKVVSAPQNPVPNRGRMYVEGGSRSPTRTTTQARTAAPARLITSVVHGKPPPTGNRSSSSARSSAPTMPPIATAASTRGSRWAPGRGGRLATVRCSGVVGAAAPVLMSCLRAAGAARDARLSGAASSGRII